LVAGFAGVAWKWREAEDLRKDEHAARTDADLARQLAGERAAKVRREVQALASANPENAAGQKHKKNREWPKAAAAFTQAIDYRPDIPYLWMARGELYAQLGLWDLAAADYSRVVGLQNITDSHNWLMHAFLRLTVGDKRGYRKTCQEMAK